MENDYTPPSHDEPAHSPSSGKFLRRLGLMAGSALLGGIAVALWSRKSLHRVRQSLDEGRPHPRNSDSHSHFDATTDADPDSNSDSSADSGFSED